MTLIKMIDLWKGLKARREALNMSQPDMAKMIDMSTSAYAHYETSAEGLTVEMLMKIDGAMTLLEMQAAKPVKKSVDNSGKTVGKTKKVYRGVRIQDVLPTTSPALSSSKGR